MKVYSKTFSWYTTWYLSLYFEDFITGTTVIKDPWNTIKQVCTQTRDSSKGAAIERFFFKGRYRKINWNHPSELQISFLNLCKDLPANNSMFWFKIETAIKKKDKKTLSVLVDEGNLLLFAKEITN
jgi:hypothetical protein